MAVIGASVRLRRLRQRFGISAPRLAIRTHVAWYWRVLVIALVLSLLLGLSAWIYDSGMRLVGVHGGASSQEVLLLKNRVLELDAELAKLRSLVGSGESSLQMERATQKQLSLQVKALEVENASLREDLAFFEGLMPASAAGDEAGLRIENLRIDATGVSGEYRYRMIVVNGGVKQPKAFDGGLEILARVRQGGKDVMINVTSSLASSQRNFRFEINNFRRVEGVFVLRAEGVIEGVEARLLQDGSVRAKQSVTL